MGLKERGIYVLTVVVLLNDCAVKKKKDLLMVDNNLRAKCS